MENLTINTNAILSKMQEEEIRLKNEQLANIMRTYNTIGGFSMGPCSITFNSVTSSDPIKLCAEYEIEKELLSADPNQADRFIKMSLARKLAKQMVDEDLIKIYHDTSISTAPEKEKFRAEVKFIQE